jgi:hypothetical protein
MEWLISVHQASAMANPGYGVQAKLQQRDFKSPQVQHHVFHDSS